MNVLIYIPYSTGIEYKNLLLLSIGLSRTNKITILTFDKALLNNVSSLSSDINVIYKSHSFNSSSKLGRIRFWHFIKNISVDFTQYDVLVLNHDCTIDGFVLSKKIPSFVLHSGMDVFNATTVITKHRYRGSKFLTYPLKVLEKWIGYKFLPRLSSEVHEFKLLDLLIDISFGWNAKGIRRGLGPSVGLLLSGENFRYQYEKIGVNNEKIHVTGVPQYDDLYNSKKYDYKTLKDRPIVFFNSSTSNPDKGLINIVSEIRNNFSNKIIIAGHPKATKAVKTFITDVASQVKNVEVLLEKRSDDENKILLLDAYFLVQRHSTLGLYAMSARVPILSYSSEFEHPFDEMYFFLNSKYHARSLKELPQIIKNFNTDLNNGNMDKYLTEQSERYAISDGGCCNRISKVLYDYHHKAISKNSLNKF
jgi:hypothetical protein